MAYTDAEQSVIEFGQKVEKFMKHHDFIDIIQTKYMDEQVISIGKNFDGSIDTLEAITHLHRWLNQQIDDANNIINSKQG